MPAQKRPPPPPPPLAASEPRDDHGEAPPTDAYEEGGDAAARGSPSAEQPQRERREDDQEEQEEVEEEKPKTQPQPQPQTPPQSREELQLEQEGGGKEEKEIPPLKEEQKDASEGDDDDGGSPSSSGTVAEEKSEFILIKLGDIRREVQCPICLGIIRKTRTVMECLHRFCRECIDKSMRLGNNECPACRTHCASRRSLRDDPNYDALIAALYPDIDKYEAEELAFREEDKLRNKKIQASIAETYLRQSEALGKRRYSAKATAAAFLRRSQGSCRNSHGHNSYPRSRSRVSRDTSIAASDDDDEDANANDGGKDSSSADESSPDIVRQKRRRRWGAPRFSPAPVPSSMDEGYDEHDDLEVGREHLGASPGRVGNREVLVWGKNGARSQTRHGSSGGSVGKNMKGSRITRLIEYLRNLDENENEFDIHLTLLPLDEQNLPGLQQPYLCCRPTLLIRQLCQFIAHQLPVQAEEVEILARKPGDGGSMLGSATVDSDNKVPQGHIEDHKELQILESQESLASLQDYFSWSRGNLVLVYRSKSQHL